jgi:hypothetical protein
VRIKEFSKIRVDLLMFTHPFGRELSAPFWVVLLQMVEYNKCQKLISLNTRTQSEKQ